jgi:hypothetical protein
MATRSIVTSQPDVTCDVCDRRLLRGEHPETFLADGQRRTVCELCAPRATHEGWLRDTGEASVSVAPLRPRRGRNLFDRLRQAGRPNGASAEPVAASTRDGREPRVYDALEDPLADELLAPEPGSDDAGRAPVFAGGREAGGPDADGGQVAYEQLPPSSPLGVDERVARAVEMFNAGEHPRRIAGVARSLGVAGVSVRPDKDFGSLVSIVIAWELCWYRYGVDIDDQDAGVRVLAQGTELSELTREERLANASADESGALSLTAA